MSSELERLLEEVHASIPDEAWVKVAQQMARRQFMPIKDAPPDVWVLAWKKGWFLPMPSMLQRTIWVGYYGGNYHSDDQPTHFFFWPELPK